MGKPVAPVDVEVIGHRTNSMRGVEIPVAVDGMLRAPAGFTEAFFPKIHTTVVRTGPVVELYTAQVVLISTFQVHHLPKQSLPHHIQHGHDIPAIAHVFQKEQMLARFFLGAHQLPALVEGKGTTNLYPHVFTGLHRCNGLFGMPLPGRGNDHRIQIVLLQHAQIIFRALVIYFCRRSGLFSDHFLGALDHLGIYIADRSYYAIAAVQREVHVRLTAQANPYEPEVQFGIFIGCLLWGRTLLGRRSACCRTQGYARTGQNTFLDETPAI